MVPRSKGKEGEGEMRCCDWEFRKECNDTDTVLTAFVRCNIREQKIKQREAEQALRTPQNDEVRE